MPSTTTPIVWTSNAVYGGGERHTASDPLVGTLATIVQLPLTVARIYWNDGRMTDLPTIAAARLRVERHFTA